MHTLNIIVLRGGLEAMSRGGQISREARKIFSCPPLEFFCPPLDKILGGGQNNSRGGQIIFHSFTEETLDQGVKFMSLFSQNHVKIA